jgi:hypothetical protein
VYVAITKPLFAWDCLQDSPSLGAIKQFLASIPGAVCVVVRESRTTSMVHCVRPSNSRGLAGRGDEDQATQAGEDRIGA